MSRPALTLSAVVLAACASEPETVVAPSGESSAYHGAALGSTGAVIVGSVTGSAEHSFFQGDLHRHVTVNARRHADGRVDGSVAVVLHGAARHPVDGERVDPIRYDVTCLAIQGNRAWVGGRIVGPRDDPYSGGEDVWYLEAGAAGAPDRAAVWIGRAASRCREQSAATGWPSERGALVVRSLSPGA